MGKLNSGKGLDRDYVRSRDVNTPRPAAMDGNGAVVEYLN